MVKVIIIIYINELTRNVCWLLLLGACLMFIMKKESIVTKKVTGNPSKIMGPIDFLEVCSESLPDTCSAAILSFENTWAIPFKKALLKTGAELADKGRIPNEVIRKVERGLIPSGGE
jgi:hypothetical protein